MTKQNRKPFLNLNHMMMGCRFDVWLRLLIVNRFQISLRNIPQTLLITIISLILFPFALLERVLLLLPLRHRPVREPLFVLGHWRSGTTYLQNLLSRDPQFGYFDPVSTVTCHNSWLLRPLLRLVEKNALADARPMDNMQYTMDLPMEEMLAVNLSSQVCIAHMLCFVKCYQYYLDQAFVDELPCGPRRNWGRVYTYLLKKQTFLCRNKQLMLKSPDSTCHAVELLRLFPDGKFINIYRNPYNVIPSTINMFNKLFAQQALQDPPDSDLVEKTVLELFKRTYQKFFAELQQFPADQLVEVRYEDFEQRPIEYMRNFYEHLGLGGFEAALPRFQEYVDSQKGYQKNHFTVRPELVRKINQELKFYFEHYGYEMMQEV